MKQNKLSSFSAQRAKKKADAPKIDIVSEEEKESKPAGALGILALHSQFSA